jgi:hypothetical protein
MAKIKTYLWLLCAFIYCACAAQQNHIECLKKTFSSQIGVLEATGHNDGDQVAIYLQSAGLGPGYAWCAAFVNWTHIQCDLQTPKSPAWSPSWFPTSRTIYIRSPVDKGNRTPGSGTVFGIYFENLKRIAHVGFIDVWGPGDWAITVEGNTNIAGSRDGDGIYRKKRLKRQIYKVADWTHE